ncbi:4-amino-4-deoxy-L-arabinose transferase-like glycosyltransferase [Roseibium hamelinense]|uniref:4-amino-4-deoxy-L-arabinose transferase-like glycosyltransferase n=1 Tax=Roseibium hamelinense TaxID=150831 RepID=A0A562THS4_9HYPH|nr:glycosyltransferase family 39 protein [Roseibium hamelinense]TWI92728.1 4-amino-4-deoxy-L-arabinose transferase-like glycosyltransferase [Roseibium hamelinense]
MTLTSEPDAQQQTPPAPARKPLWLKIFGHDVSAPLFLLVLALLLFVPGQWTVPPLDRDEPRFTQATKQMLETGDYVDIRFQDEARHKKPVGIYWLQAAAAKLTGKGAEAPLWVYRLPSIIGATLAVLATFWLARAFMGPAGALVAGMFVASAIILGVEARLAKTDAMLFFTIVLAQGALARIWLRRTGTRMWGMAFVFWTALAGSVLIKGPVGPMVIGLTVVLLFALERKVTWFKSAAPLVGFIWFVLLVLPWFAAIWIATDGTFFTEAIGQDLLGKVREGQESHGAPPLTHLGAMFGVFWPLPAFFLISLPLIWSERKSPLVVFCFAWFVPSWIIFEMVATKLPHYTMPLLPALVLPVAAALVDGAGGQVRPWLRWVAAILLAVPVIGVAAAAFGGPFFLGNWPSPPGTVLCAFAVVLALAAATRIVRAEPLKALSPSVGAAILTAVGVWGFVGPALTGIWISPRLVAAMDAIPGCQDRSVVTAGFHEPSFIFLEGTHTKILPPAQAAEFLAQTGPGCRIAAIESREEGAFLEAAKAIGLVPVAVSRVDGLNINGGDETDIGLYRAGGASSER